MFIDFGNVTINSDFIVSITRNDFRGRYSISVITEDEQGYRINYKGKDQMNADYNEMIHIIDADTLGEVVS